MPTLTITKNYGDGAALTEAHLDTAFESVETFLNTTKLDTNNLQSGAVEATNIASGAVTEAKLGAGAVATAKIADAAVTQAKLAARSTGSTVGAGGVALSSSCGTYSVTTSNSDVTNLSVSITTTGRPVQLTLSSAIATVPSAGGSVYNAGASVYVSFLRGATVVASFILEGTVRVPGPAFQFLDTGASAGTYTYKVQAVKVGGSTAEVIECKLVAYEI